MSEAERSSLRTAGRALACDADGLGGADRGVFGISSWCDRGADSLLEEGIDRRDDKDVRGFEMEDELDCRNMSVGRDARGLRSSSRPISLKCRDSEEDVEGDERILVGRDLRPTVVLESLRVRGDGASSSSLSLQPRPVVRPMPPLSSLPSR